MHINNLLLSLAAPVASRALGAAAGAAQSLGQSFVHFLAEAPTTDDKQSAPLDSAAIARELTKFADDLRDFLASHQITQGFRIRLEKSANGELTGGVSGPNADPVAALLQKRPNWFGELADLAGAAQFTHQSPRTSAPPHLNIEITEHGTSHWYLR